MSPRQRLELKVEPLFAPKLAIVDALVLVGSFVVHAGLGLWPMVAFVVVGSVGSVMGKRYFGFRP